MNSYVWLPDRHESILYAAWLTPPDGSIIELGVATGASINQLAGLFKPRLVYGFDSFDGLPEPWGSYEVGHFACPVPDVTENVRLVVGMFAETLPPFVAGHHDNIALMHVDCDLYSSTRTALIHLAPRLVTGSVVLLDEFFCCEDQERRAFEEYMLANARACRLAGRSNEQAIMVIE